MPSAIQAPLGAGDEKKTKLAYSLFIFLPKMAGFQNFFLSQCREKNLIKIGKDTTFSRLVHFLSSECALRYVITMGLKARSERRN